MQVNGLEFIKHSKVLQLFFEVSKDWMSAASKMNGGEESGERTMRILPKIIGRHPGFVVHILSADKTVQTTFYAKVQSVSMDTVLIHHVLKSMNCGPEVFHLFLLEDTDGFSLGVITEKVKDWSMVRTLTPGEHTAFLHEKNRLLSSSFLLNILIELGNFGNIPNNKENWGFVDNIDNSVPFRQMSVIDFSRGNSEKRTFENEERFREHWEECVYITISRWHETIYGGPYVDRLFAALQKPESIAEQAEHFPFLQSAEAFTALLQSACDATAEWLHEAVQRDRYNCTRPHPPEPTQDATDTTEPTTDPLTPFRHVPRPSTVGLDYQYDQCVEDYEDLVYRWNDILEELYSWFPFPSAVRTQATNDSRTRQPSSVENGNENAQKSVYQGTRISTGTAAYMYNMFKPRSLSMEVNVCEGDVGAATERNVRYAGTVFPSFVPGYDYIGPTAVDSKSSVSIIASVTCVDNVQAVRDGGSDTVVLNADVPVTVGVNSAAAEEDNAGIIVHTDNNVIMMGVEKEDKNSVNSSDVVQMGKKRKSKNKGRKQRKRARRHTIT